MTSTTIDYFRQSIAAVKTDPDRLQPFIQRFSDQPMFVPTVDPATLPEGKLGILFTHVDEMPDVPVLVAAPNKAAAQALFQLDEELILELDGAFILGMTHENRFALVLQEGEDIQSFDYRVLVVMAQGFALFKGDGVAGKSDPAVARAAYPTAFAKWLYEYCRDQRDISDAWLALISYGSENKPGVCVLFDDYASAAHDQRVREQAHLLLPGQMLFEYAQLQRDTRDDSDDLMAKIRAQPPMYSRSHKQGWWAHLQRRRKPTTVAWLQVDIKE